MQLDDLVRLRRARDRMDRDFALPLCVADLAAEACMSAGHFHRCFRAAYGETPHAYLAGRRVERAMELLRRGGVSITEVCMAVGFTSLGSFSATFARIVGQTPSQYRMADHSTVATLPPCVARQVLRPRRPASGAQTLLAGGRSDSEKPEPASVA